MRNPILAVTLTLLTALCTVEVSPGAQALNTPGETSGSPLAPLLVTGYNRATGALNLTYQSGCATTGNTIRYGSLSQVGSLTWSGSVCGAGSDGSYSGFNPGSGSYFFVIVGNDSPNEGSYGRSRFGTGLVERPPQAGVSCGVTQNLTAACTPAGVGATCLTSDDCGARTSCVANATGGAQCACLPPFGGTYCQACAPGYAGPECRDCAAGFVSNKMQNENGGDLPDDPTAPSVFRCEADVAGNCSGRSCNGHGTCAVYGRDAVCACQPGYTGADCEECAPNYQANATGACTLGGVCRDAKCGGHGNCIPAAFGEVACQCDSGYSGTDCGGPALTIVASSETLTLYEGQSIVLSPQGGVGPYTWQLLEGPARLDPCDPRGGDPTCPINSVRVTALEDALTDGLMIIRSMVTDGVGLQTAMNLAANPSTFLPFTGAIKTELVPFYNAMLTYMRARGIRGGVLGISKGGVIIATNGYGYRDAGLDADPFVNAGEPGPLVQPDSPFRIASVTKTLTAAAVRGAAADAGVSPASSFGFNRASNWVQQSLGLNLDSGPAPIDYNLTVPGVTDARWANVTINHLLNHHVGFWRDSSLPSTTGLPTYSSSSLAFTVDLNNQSGLQSAVSGFSNDMSYAWSHVFADMQLTSDPRPTVRRMIEFAAGNTFQYPPGGNIVGGSNYANIGYMLAGRVLEGLKGESYDPDDPSAPEGWGKFPTLLRRYLCEASGVVSGIYPGDEFNPQPFEPYFRDLDVNGVEKTGWDTSQGADTVRFNNQTQKWEFCQSNCFGGQAVWGSSANAPNAYGAGWLAQRNSAGGIVATTSALLRFARNHRVRVGTPGDPSLTGIGSPLAAPGQYTSGSSHTGSLPGVSSVLWQMSGNRTNNVPLPTKAWNSDPSAPLDIDINGNVVISETTVGASSCALPSDVAVAAMFNQREDRRAPGSQNNSNFSNTGNSSNSGAYGRIFDFLGDAACKVKAAGWPQIAAPPAQVVLPPICP